MAVKLEFNALSAQFPSGSYPEISQYISGSVQQLVLGFDATNVERCFFYATAASGWSGSMSASVWAFPQTATSGSVVWELSVDARSPGEAMNASSFAATASALMGVDGASLLESIELTPDDDGAVAGDQLRFLLRRLTTHTSDNMTGDSNFVSLVIADGR